MTAVRTWADRYPYWFRAVRLKRDEVIEFYQWMIDERAWDGRVFMNSWREADFAKAISNWTKQDRDQTGILEIHFRNEVDAVAFKLRYADADYGGQETAIRANA